MLGLWIAPFFKLLVKTLHLPCNISILGLESESNVNASMDLLEEGISEGERSGRAIVSREEGDWINIAVSLDATLTEGSPNEPDSQSSASASNENESIISETVKTAPEPDLTSPTTESIASPSNLEETQQAANDISAVASPDDIAALFAQINTQKSGTGVSGPSPSADTAKQPEQTSSDPVADTSEAATADDIAALFATVKPNAKSVATPATSATPTIPPATASATPAPDLAEIDKTEAASADDIAALFATVKPKAKAASVAAPDASPVAAKAQPSETPKPVAEMDPNEAASADDIASLFATVKPTAKAANVATAAVPASDAKAQPSETVNPVADVDPNEAASADDIAALFATVKPTAKAPVAPAPSESKPVELSDSERAESATADDIAALFATVKTAVKPATPATPSTPPKPDSSPSPVSSIPTGEELSEVASADDIAMLLATVKPTLTAPNQSTQASTPTPSAILPGEQLNEAASADDIEALFAAMKK